MSFAKNVEADSVDLPFGRIVVFHDKAEVTRLLKVDLAEGLNEILIKNITENLIPDSLRIEGRGDALIHEMSEQHQPYWMKEERPVSEKAEQLKTEIKLKNKHVRELEARQKILEKKIAMFETVSNQVSNNLIPTQKKNQTSVGTLIGTNGSVQKLDDFLTNYEATSMAFQKELSEVIQQQFEENKELEKLNKAQDKENSLFVDLGHDLRTKMIRVVLEATTPGEVELKIIYQVRDATWTASYDIRLLTDNDGKDKLKVTYSGKILQRTNENWKNAPLVLSAMQKEEMDRIPELKLINVQLQSESQQNQDVFQNQRMMQQQQQMNFGTGRGGLFGAAAAEAVPAAFAQPTSLFSQSAEVPRMKFAQADVSENKLNAEFNITKPATIPSDGIYHMVTIGVMELNPNVDYECVIRKSRSVFMIATAVNSSALPFIAGEASVYLKNSFVNKTEMKAVSPGETFSCFLGVDSAIRVAYKPAKRVEETAGTIGKYKRLVRTQKIMVKNNRANPILVTLREPIPKSSSDSIKVSVVSPEITSISKMDDDAMSVVSADLGEFDKIEAPKTDLKGREPGARLTNEDGALEWTVSVDAHKTTDLELKWIAEYPLGETLSFIEK